MKVKNFTHLWCCFMLVCMLAIPHLSFSQSGPTLACNDNVQISLNSDCSGITPDMLLEGDIGSIGVTMGPSFLVEIGSLTGGAISASEEFGQDSNGDGVINAADFIDAAAMSTFVPLNLGSIANSGPVTYKVTETSTGNSCWGTVTVELNLLPTLESPCIVTPGSKVSTTVDLEDLTGGATATLNYTPNGCGAISISTNPGFVRYPCDLGDDGMLGTPDDGWCNASCSFADNGIGVDGMGTVTISLNPSPGDLDGSEIPSSASCTVTVTVADCVPCIAWCSEDDSQSFPDGFITVGDIEDMIARGCFLDIVGDIIVNTDSSGDACSGTTVITYTANVERHGAVTKEVLLTQGFGIMGLNPLLVQPPRSTTLDCGEISQEATPDEIFAATGSGSLAYPFFSDKHTEIPRMKEFSFLDHFEVAVDTVDRLVAIDIDTDKDGINDDQVWVLLPVVEKELDDSLVTATYPIDAMGVPICFNDDGNCVACELANDDGDVLIPFVMSTTCIPATDFAIVHIEDGSYCNLIVSMSDSGPFEACGSGFKIIRQWSVIDWCSANAFPIELGTQFIEVIDTEAPEIGDLKDDVVSIDPWTCTAVYPLALPDAEDGCDGTTIDFNVNLSHGVYDAESGFIVGLFLTDHPVTIDINVSDDCGNSTPASFELTVIDLVPPVPVCNNNLTVTLTGLGAESGDGVAKIFADAFDAGSNDAGCGDVTVEVARMTGCCDDECTGGETICLERDKFGDCVTEGVSPEGDDFGPFVKFCCMDAGQTVMVIVQVTDAAGNINQCMVEVQVVDKSAAALVCPDVEISCLEDPNSVDVPSPIAAVCAGASALQIGEDVVIEDGCGTGQILREYIIDQDGDGAHTSGEPRCTQTIIVTGEGAFDPMTIKWPIHYNGEVEEGINLECDSDDELVVFEDVDVPMNPIFTCSAGTVTDAPLWCDNPCGLVGFSVEDETVTASDACLKIIRRWTVIDWCTWDPNQSGRDDDNDTGDEDFIAVEDWTDNTECAGCPEASGVIRYFQFDDGEFEEDGYYTFDQVIKVVDDNAPTITPEFDDTPIATNGGNTAKGQDGVCTGSAPLTQTATDACGGEDVGSDLLTWVVTREEPDQDPFTLTGTGASFTMSSGEGSPGEVNTITWVVTDGCGNSTTSVTTHTFGDSKAPTPICISGVTTAFMETTGGVDIWAGDFDLGSFDNCTADDDLVFTIGLSGGDAADATPNFSFDCDDLQNFYELNVFVTDSDGNTDFCQVGVLVGGDCGRGEGEAGDGSQATIAGNIATRFGDMVDDAIVSVNGNAGAEFPKSAVTGDAGEYAFSNNPLTFDYDLGAEKLNDYTNGVSTLDIVLIQKHILGLTSFESPYSYLAADINGSGSISASDLVELRELILGKTLELSNNSSWRFVDASQEFFDATNPFPFNESIAISNLSNDMMTENFIGIKIGDISGDAVANSLMTGETRTNGLLTLTAEDNTFEAGQVISVPVSAENFNAISGYQFTLNHTGLELQSVTAGAIDVTDTNVGVSKGQLTMSWAEAQAISTSDVLFTLVFRATSVGQLSTALNLNSSVTKAEAYVGVSLDRADVNLNIGSTELTSAFDLYQNSPNPFGEETIIGFNLPESGTARLSVYDVAGKSIMTMTGTYVKGYNEIVLTKTQVGVEGVLYYELESGDNIATRKMIVIE